MSVTRASLCAVLTWFGSPDVVAAKLQHEETLIDSLRNALTKYSVAARTPWLTAAQATEQLVRGNTPGTVPWVNVHGQTRQSAQMAVALHVPEYMSMHLASDSTLVFYSTQRGKGRTPWDGTYRHTNHPHLCTADIVCGDMIQDITRRLSLRSAEAVQETDCTIVVCMLNAPPNQHMLTHAEMMNIGPHVNALCQELERHKRPAIIVGGSAELWKFPLEWNHLVNKCVTMCRAHGFPTIDGTQYFRIMQTQEHGFHFIKTAENMEHGMQMLEETRNML